MDTYNRASPNGTGSLFVPAPGAPTEFRLFQEGLQSSWELDLFGRIRRAVEAQDANLLASVESRHAVALAALTELAQSYMMLRGTQDVSASPCAIFRWPTTIFSLSRDASSACHETLR
jgi:outer membrane protein TolC